MKLAYTLTVLMLTAFLGGCITANESMPWHLMVCNQDGASCHLHVRATSKRSCEYVREKSVSKDRCELMDCAQPSADITSYCVNEKDKKG